VPADPMKTETLLSQVRRWPKQSKTGQLLLPIKSERVPLAMH